MNIATIVRINDLLHAGYSGATFTLPNIFYYKLGVTSFDINGHYYYFRCETYDRT